MNTGILIVSFGTTYHETRERNIDRIAAAVKEVWPAIPIYQAYSSEKVRKTLRERDGILIADIPEALRQMEEDGIRNVRVLPTHIIDGIENHRMKQLIAAHASAFASVRTAGALLVRDEDYVLTAKAVWDSLKKDAGDCTVIFMGHGSAHEADESYERMEEALRSYACRPVYIATVEGRVGITDVIERMHAAGDGKREGEIVLTPFMLVAGDHAQNDMAGEEDSFRSCLEAEGWSTRSILRGIGEYPAVRELYLQHLKEIMDVQSEEELL